MTNDNQTAKGQEPQPNDNRGRQQTADNPSGAPLKQEEIKKPTQDTPKPADITTP